MKTSKLIKAASAGILSLGLTTIPFAISASAQDTTSPNETTTSTTTDVDFDWGWLGLLGLVGLAGLAGRKRDDVHHQRHEIRADHTRVDHPVGQQTDVSATPRSDAPRYRDPYRDPK